MRDAGDITTVYSAVGKEHGYMLLVERFSALGFTLTDFDAHILDMPDRYDFHGLLGLSFLRRFNDEIRSRENKILVEPA
ncbi:MAG: hypothetical protein KF773_11065 [Deltaproteobacteria bacterium]|nr:hypothetical protein [Deltaproteobacteria bacterium]